MTQRVSMATFMGNNAQLNTLVEGPTKPLSTHAGVFTYFEDTVGVYKMCLIDISLTL